MSDAASTMLLKEDRGSVRILKLNRPEVRNALNDELRAALVREVRTAESDSSVRAIVLTGEGPKAFSAGADIHALILRTPQAMLGQFHSDRIDFILERSTKPVFTGE
jgi:enoyl-CoA hydratase/carnithine racemase